MNKADGAQTLIHEFTQALLHFDVDDGTEQSKHGVEAEAVAYVVRRYLRIDTSDSAFYLTAWKVRMLPSFASDLAESAPLVKRLST